MTTNAMQMTPTGGPGLHLNLGEKVPIKQSTLTVTETDVAVLPRLRDYLMGVARARGTVTYTEVPATVPADAGASVFAGFYDANEAFGSMTVSFTTP